MSLELVFQLKNQSNITTCLEAEGLIELELLMKVN